MERHRNVVDQPVEVVMELGNTFDPAARLVHRTGQTARFDMSLTVAAIDSSWLA